MCVFVCVFVCLCVCLSIPVTDIYHENEIVDNYRWLEDPDSKETAEWVAEQNKVSQAFLSGIPYREATLARLKELQV